MKKLLKVPRGKGIVEVRVTGHTYLRVIDSGRQETFRFDSPGKHVSAVVQPGRYTIETDGKLGRVDLAPLPPRLRTGSADSTKPPKLKGKPSRHRS